MYIMKIKFRCSFFREIKKGVYMELEILSLKNQGEKTFFPVAVSPKNE